MLIEEVGEYFNETRPFVVQERRAKGVELSVYKASNYSTGLPSLNPPSVFPPARPASPEQSNHSSNPSTHSSR